MHKVSIESGQTLQAPTGKIVTDVEELLPAPVLVMSPQIIT